MCHQFINISIEYTKFVNNSLKRQFISIPDNCSDEQFQNSSLPYTLHGRGQQVLIPHSLQILKYNYFMMHLFIYKILALFVLHRRATSLPGYWVGMLTPKDYERALLYWRDLLIIILFSSSVTMCWLMWRQVTPTGGPRQPATWHRGGFHLAALVCLI